MADYIERDKLLELYVDGKYDTADYHVPVPVIIQNIKDIPAADVRPVVLCRDCQNSYERESIDGFKGRYCGHLRNRWNPDNDRVVGDDDFCVWGRKKSNCGADMRGKNDA